jgi:hypothetical protein
MCLKKVFVGISQEMTGSTRGKIRDFSPEKAHPMRKTKQAKQKEGTRNLAANCKEAPEVGPKLETSC